ncbi:hypothetical protein KW787_00435 [Candidatus Pacearchaeota archaeon]|nr:hypothetical protein [Candidatus Pacearchaeota archaeon]
MSDGLEEWRKFIGDLINDNAERRRHELYILDLRQESRERKSRNRSLLNKIDRKVKNGVLEFDECVEVSYEQFMDLYLDGIEFIAMDEPTNDNCLIYRFLYNEEYLFKYVSPELMAVQGEVIPFDRAYKR